MRRKFDPDLPMTLILSLLDQGDRCACRGNLVVSDGLLQDVIKVTGNDSWATLEDALSDAKLIVPKQLDIYTNSAPIINALAPPVRLDVDAPVQWRVLRKMLALGRWRVTRVEASNLKRAKELLG